MLNNKKSNSARPGTFPLDKLKREIYRLYVLGNLFQRMFKIDMEAKYGVTLVEWKIIESIFHAPGITANGMIDFWEFDKTAASRSVVRLEKAGFIKRQVSQEDGRRYQLFLTAKGRRMYKNLQDSKETIFQDIEQHLSAGELHQMADTTEKMIDHLRKMLAERRK